MDAIDKISQGHKRFQQDVYTPNKAHYDELCVAQHPKAMVIACSDSRVDPGTITQARPGDLFVVRNVANLVPAFEDMNSETHHGTSAALEYGVNALEVEHIIVLGHWGCGGIEALIRNDESISEKFPFVHRWLGMAHPARQATLEALPDAPLEQQCRHCEKESIQRSLQNLMTFPCIIHAARQGKLQLHGWYFDLPSGQLLVLDQEKGTFSPMLEMPE